MVRLSREKQGRRIMKQVDKWVLVGAIIVALFPGPALADQPPKSNSSAKRPTKPSVFQSLRNEMRVLAQEAIDFSKYIRGNGPPRYN